MNFPQGAPFAVVRRAPAAAPSPAVTPWVLAAVLVVALWPVPLRAADYIGTPDSYLERVRQLKAGDRLLLQPGRYRGGLAIHGLQGTSEAPIVIEGPATGEPAVFVARAHANTVSIRDAAHVAIRHLVLDGRNLPVDAVRVERRSKWAHDLAFEDLLIVDHGFDQQTVGISAQFPSWNWTVRHCVIVGAGTGMYLGSSDGTQPFVHGVIEHNLVLDSVGYDLQIKHQGPRPALAGMPSVDGATVIRGNVFVKGDRSSSGSMARPNVLVGHFPPDGPGSEDRYLIEGNVFLGNPSESLFQGEGNITLRRNLLVNLHGDGIVVQPHHAEPRRIEITRNLIATRGVPMRVSGTDPRFPARVHDNEVIDPELLHASAGRDDASRHANELERAVARWLAAAATDDDATSPALAALERALRLACGGPPGIAGSAAAPILHTKASSLCARAPLQ